MMYQDAEGVMYPSERTLKYIEDGDQPSFFKDVCYKFQFPNGVDKSDNLIERISSKISIRPYCFVISVLLEAQKKGANLTKNEIAYFVLNNLDALRGQATTAEIINEVFKAREQKILYKVEHPGKEASYSMQHITEQLNYLELANLVTIDNGLVFLNMVEKNTLEEFAKVATNLGFDIYKYDIETLDGRNELYYDWQVYYGALSDPAKDGSLETSTQSLAYVPDETPGAPAPMFNYVDTMKIGDDGEKLVWAYEVKRVGLYDKRLTNKILMLGKTKGLGYDIQSIFAEGSEPEFVKYIEVKSTKRVTMPDLTDDTWIDTLNLTRNEWVAASQHKTAFEIYRVYLTKSGPLIIVIKNPYEKNEQKDIRVIPTTYRLDFSNNAIDNKITQEMIAN
jgi:hypothetical protein